MTITKQNIKYVLKQNKYILKYIYKGCVKDEKWENSRKIEYENSNIVLIFKFGQEESMKNKRSYDLFRF